MAAPLFQGAFGDNIGVLDADCCLNYGASCFPPACARAVLTAAANVIHVSRNADNLGSRVVQDEVGRLHVTEQGVDGLKSYPFHHSQRKAPPQVGQKIHKFAGAQDTGALQQAEGTIDPVFEHIAFQPAARLLLLADDLPGDGGQVLERVVFRNSQGDLVGELIDGPFWLAPLTI